MASGAGAQSRNEVVYFSARASSLRPTAPSLHVSDQRSPPPPFHYMNIDLDDVETALGSQDISLRIALAEAEVEISLLKAELVRTQSRLEKAESLLRSQLSPESGIVSSDPRASAPPSVRVPGTVFRASEFPTLPLEGDVLPLRRKK